MAVQIDIGDLNPHQLAHPDGGVEEKFRHDLMLDIAAFLNDLKESLQVALTQQLCQPPFSLPLAQAQFPPGLLADVEEAVVIEPLLPRDPDEPRDGRISLSR